MRIQRMTAGRFFAFVLLLGFSWNTHAHTIRQNAGFYSDNQGTQTQRLHLELGVQFATSASWLAQTRFDVAAYRDHSQNARLENDPYAREVYGSGMRVSEMVRVAMTYARTQRQDFAAGVIYSSDGSAETQGVSLAFSQWLYQDSLQLAIDGATITATRPVMAVLGEDRDFIVPPERLEQHSFGLYLRHLATPTTIMSYNYLLNDASDRPLLHGARVEWREYFPSRSGALHASLARLDNTGEVSSLSPLGELQAWLGEIAWLQSINRSWHSRIAYRQYREDETTRVRREQYFLGTDAVSLGSILTINRYQGRNADRPVSVDMQWTHYRSNEFDDSGRKMAANMYELGVQTEF